MYCMVLGMGIGGEGLSLCFTVNFHELSWEITWAGFLQVDHRDKINCRISSKGIFAISHFPVLMLAMFMVYNAVVLMYSLERITARSDRMCSCVPLF